MVGVCLCFCFFQILYVMLCVGFGQLEFSLHVQTISLQESSFSLRLFTTPGFMEEVGHGLCAEFRLFNYGEVGYDQS